MSPKVKQRIIYVLTITVIYFLLRNVVERSMDGAWIPIEKWWMTALEGLVVGLVLMFFQSGKDQGRMPN